MRKALVLAAAFFLVVSGVAADRLQLANGDIVSGTIVRMDETTVVIRTEYGVLEIERDRIVRGSFGGDFPDDRDDSLDDPAADGRTMHDDVDPTADDQSARADRDPLTEDEVEAAEDPETRIPSLEDGLVFHFPFNGTLDDATGNYRATNNGMRRGTGADGRQNGALRSDGSGTYLSIASDGKLNGLDEFTIAFWVYPENNAPTQYLVSKWTRADAERADGKFTLQTARGGLTLFVVDQSGSYQWVSARNVLQEDQWQSVVVTYADGRAALYVGGQEVASRLFEFDDLFEDDAPLLLMTAEAATEEPFSYYNTLGSIDEVRLYDRALSETEVALLAAVGENPN